MRVDIVGAGPAGLAVALNLLDGSPGPSFDVHVWERKPEVGTTPCGEGIEQDKLALLPGFDSQRHVGATLRGAAVDAPGARRLTVDMACVTMRRSRWIPAMADEAQARGATLHLGRNLKESDIRQLPGDVVVGADGPSSRVERLVGNPRRFVPAIQARYDDTPELDGLLVFRWDPAVSPDYSWVFPRGDHTSVGTLAPATDAAFADMEKLARAYGVHGRLLWKESYPIPFGGSTVVAGRYALVGDAAGVANPLTKGGMGPAFLQARMLTDALRTADLESYAKSCAASPLFSDLPQQGLAALHRLTVTDVQRIVGSSGGPVDIRLATQAWIALRTAATLSPRIWSAGLTLVRALRHAVRWGW